MFAGFESRGLDELLDGLDLDVESPFRRFLLGEDVLVCAVEVGAGDVISSRRRFLEEGSLCFSLCDFLWAFGVDRGASVDIVGDESESGISDSWGRQMDVTSVCRREVTVGKKRCTRI